MGDRVIILCSLPLLLLLHISIPLLPRFFLLKLLSSSLMLPPLLVLVVVMLLFFSLFLPQVIRLARCRHRVLGGARMVDVSATRSESE